MQNKADSLLVDFAGPVATITFNRPDQRNALNQAMWCALPRHLAEVSQRRETRAVILRGASGNFAAGADIAEFDTVFADRQSTIAYQAAMSAATSAIEQLDLPVIAQIEGLCIGAGVAVALACDIRLAAINAQFAVTPAKLGLIYSLADTKRLTDAVGLSAAKDLLFTARMIDCPQAAKIGLIDEAFTPEEIEAAVQARAQLVAANSAWSIGRAKAIVQLIAEGIDQETLQTLDWFADATAGDDFREGLRAFRARRAPIFPPR